MCDLYEPLIEFEAQPPPPPKDSASERSKVNENTKHSRGRNVADGLTAISTLTSSDQTMNTFIPKVGFQAGIDVKNEVTPKRNKCGTIIMVISAVLVSIFLLLTAFFIVAFIIKL